MIAKEKAREFLSECRKNKEFKKAIDLIDNKIIIDLMEAYANSKQDGVYKMVCNNCKSLNWTFNNNIGKYVCDECNGVEFELEEVNSKQKPKKPIYPAKWQNLFEALERTCNFIALEDDILEIINAYEQDLKLTNK